MYVLNDPQSCDSALRRGVVTIGNFDGVHRGHAALLAACAQRAAGAAVIAVTFEPHPVVVLAPQRAPRRLTPPAEKLSQLAALGVTATIVLPADRSLLSLTAEHFVEKLCAPLLPSCIVEGPTFGFGAGRRGNVQTLRDLGAQYGYTVHVIEPQALELAGQPQRVEVSSTLIRKLLDAGELDAASACLGRPYALIGKVVAGAGRGGPLGFPTINLDCGDQQLPADAVYAGRATFEDAPQLAYAAALSVGVRATFGGNTRVVEAFLLDASGDFYGRTARLELVARLRTQRVFASPAELSEQIAADVNAVRQAVRL